jgi:hypothetical protein
MPQLEELKYTLHSEGRNAEQVVKILKAVLEAADMTFRNVLRYHFCCLGHRMIFTQINTVYGFLFDEKTNYHQLFVKQTKMS